MKISVYENFPDYAKEIREAVFVKEQGFQHEFDSIDDTAVHIVMFDGDGTPAATCRVFWEEGMGSYAIGRLAVVKKYRGRNIGADMVREAESIRQEKDTWLCTLQKPFPTSQKKKKHREAHWWEAITATQILP